MRSTLLRRRLATWSRKGIRPSKLLFLQLLRQNRFSESWEPTLLKVILMKRELNHSWPMSLTRLSNFRSSKANFETILGLFLFIFIIKKTLQKISYQTYAIIALICSTKSQSRTSWWLWTKKYLSVFIKWKTISCSS